jgi:hypothetical protein
MRTTTTDRFAEPGPMDLGRLDDDIVELTVLLPGWQVGALEKAARFQGLTTAQLVRGLIRDHLLQSC